jgi:hypothetical protein
MTHQEPTHEQNLEANELTPPGAGQMSEIVRSVQRAPHHTFT